jgi:hypothetical protein
MASRAALMIAPQVIHESAARGELVYPGAAWLPIPEQQTQPRIIVSQLIFHSMAGPRLTSLEALRAYMGRDDVHVECTAMSDMDGRMAQLVEANVRADCNYKANVRAISVETQDEGSPTLASTPWTAIQLEQHAGFAAWCHLRFSVPLRFPPTWDSPGVGYHRLYAEWSNVTGKSCPGDTRIGQMPALLARAREIAAWTPAPVPDPEDEDDMQTIITRWGTEPYLIEVGAPKPGEVRRPWRGIPDEQALALIAAGVARDCRTTTMPVSLRETMVEVPQNAKWCRVG